MAIKDFHAGEDKNTSAGSNNEAIQTQPSKENTGTASAVKNAHATGDGSYGRSDESLPDVQDAEEALPDNGY